MLCSIGTLGILVFQLGNLKLKIPTRCASAVSDVCKHRKRSPGFECHTGQLVAITVRI